MSNKVKKRVRKSGGKKEKAAVQPATSTPAPASAQATDDQSASKRFVSDLLVRGEAAELTDDGRLPLQATHVIQKKNPGGSVEVKRARYKLF